MSTDRLSAPCPQCERLNREDKCTGPELSAPFIWGEDNRLSVELWCSHSVSLSDQIHQTPEGRVFIQLGNKSLYVPTLKEMAKYSPDKFDQLVNQSAP